MSMNLHCDEYDLMQTPTYITYMCYYRCVPLFSNDGRIVVKLKYRDFEKLK